jgi:hypothetical protein
MILVTFVRYHTVLPCHVGGGVGCLVALASGPKHQNDFCPPLSGGVSNYHLLHVHPSDMRNYPRFKPKMSIYSEDSVYT